MQSLLGLITSDAALARCELDRVRRLASLEPEAGVAGLGAYQDAVVLQRRSGPGAAAAVWEQPPASHVVLLSAGVLPVDRSIEEHGQPFRFRQWLFAHVGASERADAVRARLLDQLPDFLRTVVRGDSLSEAIFGQFLAELRAVGRVEDPTLEAPAAMALLVKAAGAVSQASAEVGAATRARLALVATNGRVLVAARRGLQPLWFRLLEGEPMCPRCGVPTGALESAVVRDHRRRRSVVLATSPTSPDGWSLVPEGGGLAVDRRLAVTVA
jgi:hypothetical protein